MSVLSIKCVPVISVQITTAWVKISKNIQQTGSFDIFIWEAVLEMQKMFSWDVLIVQMLIHDLYYLNMHAFFLIDIYIRKTPKISCMYLTLQDVHQTFPISIL